jgi:uncharacterized membrane protein
MKPIARNELWHAQIVLLFAAALQLTIPNELRLGPKYLVASLVLVLIFAIAFTGPKRHLGKGTTHATISTMLIGLVSLANAVQLGLLTKTLIQGADLPGKSLLAGALAIFLTNIIVFGLWYWELDSPGLSGRHDKSRDQQFQFPQQQNDPHWNPTFFDYLYVAITNGTAFSPTDTMPLTHFAKSLMSIQALISLVTVVLVTARAVNILS